MRAQIELLWLFEVEEAASARLLTADLGPLAWFDHVMELPLLAVQTSLTDPLCTLWVRRAREACVSASNADLRRVVGRFAVPALAALSSGGGSAAATTIDLPSHFSLPKPAVAIVRPKAGPIEIAVHDGVIRLDGGAGIIWPDGSIEVNDTGRLNLLPTPIATGYGVRVEALEPSLRGQFPWIDDSEYDAQIWTRRLDASAALLEACNPDMYAEMRRNLVVVVPTSSGPIARHSTGSNRDAWGAVSTSLVGDPFFTDGLIHEHRHDLLNSIAMAAPLFEADGSATVERYYSPWRPEPRHVTGLLHAVFVFAEVCEFYIRVLAATPAGVADSVDTVRTELGLQVTRLRLGLCELEEATGLTLFGRQLLGALSQRAQVLHDEAIALDALADPHVGQTLREHYACYREKWGVAATTDINAGIRLWAT